MPQHAGGVELVRFTPELIDEVVALVYEHGALSKVEILENWPMSDEEYAFLREKVLARPHISSGGRSRGGFVAAHTRERAPTDAHSQDLRLRSTWECSTVDRLGELLRHEQMEKLLGSPRRILVHERVVEAAVESNSSILYFGPSVRDAECMAYMLRASGIPSAVVTGNTRDAVRREVISDFRAGSLKVLCNCEVLTTGFDAPRVTHVFMARPTVSQVLYEQMVGRGLRGPAFGGTASCTLIDCQDDIRGPCPQLGYLAFRRIWGAD